MANDIFTPVVRHLANSHPRSSLDVDGALRILVVDATPKTMGELNLDLEVERMKKALGGMINEGMIEFLELKQASPELLRDTLRDELVHVLHVMGHGGYHEASGMGALFFVAPDGSEDQVDGEMLGALLKRIPDLRLVVLNACKTARHQGRVGSPLCHGAASGIVDRTGMPAVVANQYAISDKAAIAFSERLYKRIAAGDPVDTALSEARLQLSWRTPEWATPVLFLSAPDGILFKQKGKKHGRSASPRSRVITPAATPLHSAWWQEKVFPELHGFLKDSVDRKRPILLDFAAHQSLAFAAGWVLEAKSGLDVHVWQRTQGKPLAWHPEDDAASESEELWLERPDIELLKGGPDLALALSVSNDRVASEARAFVEREGIAVDRIIDAMISPCPGSQSVQGGRHALRLAQALVPRVRERRPHERAGRLHIFGSAPNAFLFYLGQLSRSFGRIVLYEYAFGYDDNYAAYQKSIELPPPEEARSLPAGWGRPREVT
jgi:hypothetical protein